MSADLLLMMKDIVVMRINLDEAKYDVVNENLLPYTLKGRFKEVLTFDKIKTKYDLTQSTIASRKNYDALLSFLSSRVLPISRENAKKVYGLFGFEQVQDELNKSKIALICRAASLQDNYWVKMETDNATWSDVNLRTNSLSNTVAQVSLHGSSLSLTGVPTTPELTGQGAYAKAWFREDDGLWLYKKGANGIAEARIEVMCSNLLDNMNVQHLQYLPDMSYNGFEDEYICKCKCMTTEDISMLSGMDFDSYCNVHGIDARKYALEIDAENIYKMWIVDYLISNRDRHGLNWGFFFNCDTMGILGCHPLYDHNNAFDRALMRDKDATYLYDNTMTMRQAAKKAMDNVDFYFHREFTRDDFITDSQYESFMERAEELGIRVLNNKDNVTDTFANAIGG